MSIMRIERRSLVRAALQVVSIFIVIGAAFVPIGYACLKASQSVCTPDLPFIHSPMLISHPFYVEQAPLFYLDQCVSV